MNLEELLEQYLDYLSQVRGYSKDTIKTYSIALELLINEHEIETNKDGVLILNIMPLRLKLANHSKKAIATKLSAIRSFVKYINTFCKINLKLKGAESIKIPKTLPKPLNRDDIFKAIESADIEDRLIIKMLYSLGLRVSELSTLKIENITNGWVRVTGKGSKTREIPIVESLQSEISSFLSTNSNRTYLFEKGKVPLSSSQIRYKVSKTFKKYGIKATPHQLRHSFATDLLEEGARVSDVSELLGHSSMATTQIYTKLADSTKLKNYLKAHPLK